jgi:hypothetical protein
MTDQETKRLAELKESKESRVLTPEEQTEFETLSEKSEEPKV